MINKLFIVIFMSISILFAEKRNISYAFKYQCVCCSAEFYLNDFLIKSYQSINEKRRAISGYDTGIMQFLKQKKNVLKIRVKPFYDRWNHCDGKINCSISVEKGEDLSPLINFSGNYKMVKDNNSKRYKQSFSMECSQLMKNTQFKDLNEIIILFDADKAIQKTLLWESEKRIRLTKSDNDEIRKIILTYYESLIAKDRKMLIELRTNIIKNILYVYGDAIKEQYISGKIDRRLTEMTDSPFAFSLNNTKITRLGNNLFQAKLKNKDYLFKIPAQFNNVKGIVDSKSNKNHEESDDEDDYEEPELEEQDNITFDLFFSKIDGRWQIVY